MTEKRVETKQNKRKKSEPRNTTWLPCSLSPDHLLKKKKNLRNKQEESPKMGRQRNNPNQQ